MRLHEKITAKPLLIESNASNLPPKVLCRVTHNICNIGKRNHNNRVYERGVWENPVIGNKDIVEKINNRILFGLSEHPKDSHPDLEKTSHTINKIWIDEATQTVKCELDVLDTFHGRLIDTLLQAGCNVGVSTRADGELEEAMDEEGPFKRVIPESYKFVTVDYTADPSTFNPYPENIERSLVSKIKEGMNDSKIDKGFAVALLETCKSGEAVALLESIKVKEAADDKKETVLSKEQKEQMVKDARIMGQDGWCAKYPIGDYNQYKLESEKLTEEKEETIIPDEKTSVEKVDDVKDTKDPANWIGNVMYLDLEAVKEIHGNRVVVISPEEFEKNKDKYQEIKAGELNDTTKIQFIKLDNGNVSKISDAFLKQDPLTQKEVKESVNEDAGGFEVTQDKLKVLWGEVIELEKWIDSSPTNFDNYPISVRDFAEVLAQMSAVIDSLLKRDESGKVIKESASMGITNKRLKAILIDMEDEIKTGGTVLSDSSKKLLSMVREALNILTNLQNGYIMESKTIVDIDLEGIITQIKQKNKDASEDDLLFAIGDKFTELDVKLTAQDALKVIKVLRGQVTEEKIEGSWTISQIQKIVDEHQSEEIDGVLVDVQTASIISQVYNAISDENKKSLLSMPIYKAADKCWKLVKRSSNKSSNESFGEVMKESIDVSRVYVVSESYMNDVSSSTKKINEMKLKLMATESRIQEMAIEYQNKEKSLQVSYNNIFESNSSLKKEIEYLKKQMNEQIEKTKNDLNESTDLIVKDHKKELLKKYYETKISCIGLKVSESVQTLFEACTSEKQIDTMIHQVQDAMRNHVVHSITEKTLVTGTGIPVDPVVAKIASKVEQALSQM